MYLVDTNVLGEQMRKVPDARVLGWLSRQPAIAVSVISVMELDSGVTRAPAAKRAPLRQWFDDMLVSPAHEFLPVTIAIARAAGQLQAGLLQRGKPRAVTDLLIAATALTHGAVLVTRNTRDFEGLGVALLNPFD